MRVTLYNASEEEDVMSNNLLTLIGNATVDDYFLDRLFEEPFETVEKYGFHLTEEEREGLAELTRGEHRTENKKYLHEIYVCPRRPCLQLLLTRPEGWPSPEENEEKKI